MAETFSSFLSFSAAVITVEYDKKSLDEGGQEVMPPSMGTTAPVM
jgi:hypothetical protein